MSYFVYFAKSIKNNKVYVGFTTKFPAERISEHNAGCNAWSKNNRPFKLLYFEKYQCRADALMREKFYKSGFGKHIKKLIIENMGL